MACGHLYQRPSQRPAADCVPKLAQHLARRWQRQVRADSVEGTAVIHDATHPISKPAEPGPEAWFDLAGGGLHAQLIA